MLAVVDVFDAMTGTRPYRRPATAREADLPPGMEPVSKLGLALSTDQPCSLAEA
jgi:hypothetical protein